MTQPHPRSAFSPVLFAAGVVLAAAQAGAVHNNNHNNGCNNNHHHNSNCNNNHQNGCNSNHQHNNNCGNNNNQGNHNPTARLCIPQGRAKLCHADDTDWKISKQLQASEAGTLTWEIQLIKKPASHAELALHGWIRVRNTGDAPATLGNVVVNLQQRTCSWSSPWVSAAAVVADATNGDAATSAHIVRTGSLENAGLNDFLNVDNYVVTPYSAGGRGTFTETPGSGSLNLTDPATNTVFSLVPQRTIAPGQSFDLLYTATFDNTLLGLDEGELVRAEVIVTYGRAPRLDNGSNLGRNININGDCGVDSFSGDGLPSCTGGMTGTDDGDEKQVNSVVEHEWKCVPELEHCNATVELADTLANVSTTGALAVESYSTDIGGGAGVEQVSASGLRHVTVTTNGLSGSITNCATLTGESHTITVRGPGHHWCCHHGSCNHTGVDFEFPCCVGIEDQACDTQAVEPHGFFDGEFCTHSNPSWGGDPNAGGAAALLVANYALVYPGGEVEVGIPGPAGFSMRFTSAQAILDYLPQGSAVARALNADLVDPLTSFSRALGGNVLALKLNIDFDRAFVLGGTTADFGDLHLCNTGTALDGLTVDQVLAAGNTALGGGPLPVGMTFELLNYHLAKLSVAFSDCEVSPYARDFLCR